MRQPETKTINGRLFTFYPLAPTIALPMAATIGGIISPAAARALSASGGKLLQGDFDIGNIPVEAIADCVTLLCKELRDPAVMDIVKKLGAQTRVEITPDRVPTLEGAQLDSYLDDFGEDLFPWLMFVVKAQFWGFIKSFVRAMPKLASDVTGVSA